MRTYPRIISYAKPLWVIAPLYVVLVLLAIVFNLTGIAFFAPILKLLFTETEGQEILANPHSIPEKFELTRSYLVNLTEYYKYELLKGDKLSSLKRVCLFLIGSVFLNALFASVAQGLLAVVKSRVIKNIQKDVFDKINRLHLSYLSNEKRGDIMSRMSNDVNQVEATAVNAFNVIIKEPLTVITIFIALFLISPTLMYFTLLVLPVAGGIIGFLTSRLRKDARNSQSLLGKILGTIDETLGGMRVIKAFNAESFFVGRFSKYINQYARVLKWMDFRRSLASPLSQFLGVTAVAGVLYFGGKLVLEKSDSLGLPAENFLTFILFYAQVIPSLKSISNAFSNIQRGLISGERIFSIIDTPEKVFDSPDAIELTHFENDIEFKKVSFSYDGEHQIINDLNLQIKKGQTVAIVGPSGGGKSTLLDLLPRFHDPVSGTVTIDGNHLKKVTMKSIRNLMGIVTQEAILFNDTVFNNISFGIGASKQEVIQAAKIANAHEFIEGLENGYQTEIGDRGNKLSGGQRQRLTIARAILKNPPILLLDEATSALDSESEHLVQDALSSLMKNRTSLVIAHRFSTIQNADLIVVVKEGNIVEKGTHLELMEQNGLYKKLSDMQSV